MMNREKISEGIQFLSEAGLNLYAVLDCGSLPEDVALMMREQGIRLEEYSRLVLLGHGGRRMWEALNEFGKPPHDPVDTYSLRMTKVFIDDYLGSPRHMMLYPLLPIMISLQRLGELAGWSHPSPLALGINEQYGIWFAYRSAFLTALPLPLTDDQLTQSPCDSCYDKPCISACPSGAVQGVHQFDIYTCSDFRIIQDSPCQDRCLARMACPYAPQHQYTLEQIRYHYGLSYQTIQRYHAKKAGK
ncbi:MAG: hypothetical protein ACPGWR_07335 [Ardenticatenaceae bacterium]